MFMGAVLAMAVLWTDNRENDGDDVEVSIYGKRVLLKPFKVDGYNEKRDPNDDLSRTEGGDVDFKRKICDELGSINNVKLLDMVCLDTLEVRITIVFENELVISPEA